MRMKLWIGVGIFVMAQSGQAALATVQPGTIRPRQDAHTDPCVSCEPAQHPGKTQLGRTEQGFDWMGLWFKRNGVQSSTPCRD